MSGNKDLTVSPSEYAGSVSNVATEARTNSDDAWSQAREAWSGSEVGDRLEAISELQREFGLRFEESAKLDAQQALSDLRDRGYITTDAGTKGGQERDITPTDIERAEAALERASALQGDHHSMIPADMTYKEFAAAAYDSIRETDYGFHENRHEYACERYEQITGHEAPVNHDSDKPFLESLAEARGVSIDEAREIDREARLEVAEDLGHHRVDVTNSYLGSSYD
jgi:hypothetical protein